MKFPLSYQTANNDCGPTCLKMVAAYYGQHVERDYLKKLCPLKKTGISMLTMYRAAKAIGFRCRGVKMEMETLKEIVQEGPVILYCKFKHFVVAYKISKPGKKGVFHLADPARGLVRLKESEFSKFWMGEYKSGHLKLKCAEKKISNSGIGYALLLKPFSLQLKG